MSNFGWSKIHPIEKIQKNLIKIEKKKETKAKLSFKEKYEFENLEKEIAPGLCWQNNESMAIESIRKLKELSRRTGAELWPNHDMEYFESKNCFPKFSSSSVNASTGLPSIHIGSL